MPSSIFITTSWNTRGKAAKSLKAFMKYTSRSNITVFQNGDSPVPMDTWLEHETGSSDFGFYKSSKPVKHGVIWNWCMNNALYEWVIIVSDFYYPIDYWDIHFDLLTRNNKQEMYLLGSWAGAECFAIKHTLWQKTGFHHLVSSPAVQIYNSFLKAGFMLNLPDKKEIYKYVVFNYINAYNEPLFESDEILKIELDKEELAIMWVDNDKIGSIEGPDGTKRVPNIQR